MIIATCPASNYNASLGECSQVVYVEQEGLLPALSVSDAFFLGSAVVAAWTVGFGFKVIRKYLFR